MSGLILTILIGVVIGGAIAAQGYSKNIANEQAAFRQDKERFAIGDEYNPLHRNSISSDSAEIEMLKYRLQNTEYRERLFLLGIWYFGLSGIWAHRAQDIDPHLMAEEVARDMPWVLDNMDYVEISNPQLSGFEVNPEVIPVAPEHGIPVEMREILIADNGDHWPEVPPTDILNQVTSPENMYTMPVPWSEEYRQDPDYWVNLYGNDTPVQLPDGSVIDGDRVDAEYRHTQEQYEGDMFDIQEPAEVHVQPDVDFFPFN